MATVRHKDPTGRTMTPLLHTRTARFATITHNLSLRKILARILSAQVNLNDRGLSDYARASMAEGLANKPAGTFTRLGRRWRDAAKEAIPPSRWASDSDYEEFFGNGVVGFPRAVMKGIHDGIRKAPHWFGYGSQGGTPEDIFNALSSGITLATQSIARGGNIFRATGLTHKSNNRIQLRGLMGNVKNNAMKDVTSLIRSRNPDVRGDAQVGDAEESPSLFDLMEDNKRSREMTNILRNSTPELERRLNDAQFRLWNVVLSDPDIMNDDASGISTTQAERIHQRLYGESPSGSYLGKLWKRMLPTVLDTMEDALVRWQLATRRASPSRVASRYLEACGDTPCGTCEGCGCGGNCDGRCQGGEEAMMEKTSPAPTPGGG